MDEQNDRTQGAVKGQRPEGAAKVNHGDKAGKLSHKDMLFTSEEAKNYDRSVVENFDTDQTMHGDERNLRLKPDVPSVTDYK
jgi:hypothetical protein